MTRSVATGNIGAGNPLYYNRGSSNRSTDTIVVGNMDSSLYSSSEASASSSEKGPRVDVWAAGTNIISGGTSADTTYLNYTGTSMAAPQVAGMCALLVQMNPGMTPAQVREWVINNAKTGQLYVGDTNNATYFSNNRNLQDGNDRIAYWPYSDHRPINLSVNTEYVSF
jgi:subtilisin family serine protease